MQFLFLFFSFFFLFLFFVFLNNPISSSICKFIYNCTFKNTNKVSIIIISIIIVIIMIIFFFWLPYAKTPNLTVFLEKIVLKWNVTLLKNYMRNQNCTSEAVLLISHTLTTTTTTTKQISIKLVGNIKINTLFPYWKTRLCNLDRGNRESCYF